MNSKERSTGWVLRLLHWFCPSHLLEEIEGDLMQRFEVNVKQYGEKKARRKFYWNAIKYLRLGIVLRNRITINGLLMTTNHFKLARRNLVRNPVFSFINILGLSVGITVCMIITNYVLFEKSYDLFHENASDVYRVTYTRLIDGEFQYNKAQVFPAIGETLNQSIPEIQTYTRMFPIATHVEAILSIDDSKKSFSESKIFAVDSTFLKIFSLSFIEGDINTALSGANKFLLSKSTAKKYFGDQEAIGKTIHWYGIGDYLVTGVFEDLPENSHMNFSILSSWMQVYGERSAWNWDGFYTYLLLKPNTDIAQSEKLIQSILDEKLKAMPNGNRIKSEFKLQAVKDIHLHSQLEGEMKVNGNYALVIVLQIVAMAIIILAIINYINLSFARSIKRLKEVGIRKIVGSSQTQLVSLFFIESLTYNILALIISIIVFFSTDQFLNNLIGKPVSLLLWTNPGATVKYLFLAIILISLVSSYLPARNIIASNCVASLKGKFNVSPTKGIFRKSLLTFQFLVTIILVSGALVIQKQLIFMQNQNLGFNDQNLVIKSYAGAGAEMDSTFTNRMALFKNKIKNLAYVKNATITSNIPGRENEWVGRVRKPDMNEELITTVRTRADVDFIDTYDLKLIAGSNFTSEEPNQLIINQSAVNQLGFENETEAIGHKLSDYFEIIGVISDYHELSLQRNIKPAMFTCGQGYMKFITVKIQPVNFNNTIDEIQKEWETVNPDKPFEYFFLNDYFNKQYQNELQLSEVFTYFSGVGILIACLGLFGFTYYVTNQRVKEIGIRKVLGATRSNLLGLLSSEYFALLIIAGIGAIPISFLLSKEWLTNYPLRIQPDAKLYLIPILMVGVLTFLSILFLLVRIISKNPSESLKND